MGVGGLKQSRLFVFSLSGNNTAIDHPLYLVIHLNVLHGAFWVCHTMVWNVVGLDSDVDIITILSASCAQLSSISAVSIRIRSCPRNGTNSLASGTRDRLAWNR